MKFTASLASAFMLANAAWASPMSERAAARGLTSTRRTSMKIPFGEPNEFAETSESSNWAGIALVTTGVTEVTGTFTIPKPTVPAGGSTRSEFCGAAWVGIDGDTCQSGLIQTGIFWCVEDGEFSYEAWYEYIPAASIAYTGITVTSGDVITVTVTKTSDTGGVTTLKNVSNGQSNSHTFTNQRDGTLCGENAEWIVEDFTEGSSLVPFADFGTVTFTGATAIVNGETVTAGGNAATEDQITLVSNSGGALTRTTVSGSTVEVTYE